MSFKQDYIEVFENAGGDITIKTQGKYHDELIAVSLQNAKVLAQAILEVVDEVEREREQCAGG